MTTKELRDNITFLSALRMLESMTERELLSEVAASAHLDLRLRTGIFCPVSLPAFSWYW